MLETAERWVAVRVSVRVDPERAGVPLRVTPPLRLAGVADVQAVRVGRIVERLAEGDGELRRCPSSRRPT